MLDYEKGTVKEIAEILCISTESIIYILSSPKNPLNELSVVTWRHLAIALLGENKRLLESLDYTRFKLWNAQRQLEN